MKETDKASLPNILKPFTDLSPEAVIHSIESQGFTCDGRILALNSYENRVYQVGIEEEDPLIVKFYRPGRWSNEQILEEHEFCFELAENELPVVCPIRDSSGKSLRFIDDMRVAIFPRRGGRAPDLDQLDSLNTLAQTLGRMHCVAKAKPFEFRPELTLTSFGHDSMEIILSTLIPTEMRKPYQVICQQLLKKMHEIEKELNDLTLIRTHGDCHVGNILWRNDSPNFVDFDDARMAPAIQDLWMLLSGSREEQTLQMQEIIEGYQMFADFDYKELRYIETLRTLRIMYFSAWLAKRWDDPSFQLNFPWFNTDRYWGRHVDELKEQLSALEEPPLSIMRG